MSLPEATLPNFPIEFVFDDSDIIHVSNHGTVYSITWKALKMSKMIKGSFEDIFFIDIEVNLGENSFPDYTINVEQTDEGVKKTVTLIGETYNMIEQEIFKIIIDLLTYYSINGHFQKDSLKNIHETMSLKMLFDVYKTSNFMDITELLDECAKYIAGLIRNKSKEEIEAFFALPTAETETETEQTDASQEQADAAQEQADASQ